MGNKKHLIILGHGEGDHGATGINKTERAYLLDLGRELRVLINSFSLPVVVEDSINVYKRNDFSKRPDYYKSFLSVTEIHFNAFNGKASGGEILFGVGLNADTMDKRFEGYLREEFGFRRYLKSDWYQQTRVAKQINLPSFRLVELCFCDNLKDISKFEGNERYHAKRVLEVITERTLELKDSVIPPFTTFTTNYIIQLGAFNEYENALKQLKEIQKHFKDAFIRRVK